MLNVRDKTFLNLVLLCAIGLFFVLEIVFTYAIEKLLLSLPGAFCLVLIIFLLLVNFDTWRRIKEE